MDFAFFINSILLGVGLAMDAFSVSIANGLNEPKMPKKRMSLIAGTFAVFQIIMPIIGYFCVTAFVSFYKGFERFIPYIALALLLFIGGKMIIDTFKNKDDEKPATTLAELMVQGIATSIDALSVGFTIAAYDIPMALISSLIIGAVTFVICVAGLIIGKKFGTVFSKYSGVLGGVILIAIGMEIFIKGVFL
ncbi:MAG: manganese efflux pump [Oscillospiraceae bacterium]|nr:manganese efflux pump [Candidatus Equicaccousia limihippi]